MTCRLFWLFSAVVVLCVGSSISVAAQPPKNVILFGWDGAQRNHVNECLARGELPTLKKVIDTGKMVEIDIEGKTDTKAGWSQILTGYLPEKTGVYSNSKFQPVPEGYSIFERLEARFGTDRFVTVAVIGKKSHCGAIDPPKKIRLDQENKQQTAKGNKSPTAKADPGAKKQEGTIVEENGVKYRVTPGQPYANMHKALEVWEFGLAQDEKVGTRAIELLEQYKDKPFFFFVHFAEVDHSGHKSGENSKEYNDALISNDLWTGKIMARVKELGLAGKTQVYITADHGFNEAAKNHSSAPYVFLATNNKNVMRNGRRQDVAPTILEAFGLNVAGIEPAIDGISLTQADNRPAIKPTTTPADKEKPVFKVDLDRKPDVIYLGTPPKVVDKMLELAAVKKDDVLYDLGCGDGRIVVAAAKKFGCTAKGFDIDPDRVRDSKKNVADNGVGHLVTIERKDIFTLDLKEADVVTLYLLPELNVRLIPQLRRLKPGSRIVSHYWPMRGIEVDKVVKVTTDFDGGTEHTVYLWTTPLRRLRGN